MEVIIALLFAAAVLLIDFFPIRKEADTKENVLILAFLSVGVGVLVLHILGVKIPSPLIPVKNLVEAMLGPQT